MSLLVTSLATGSSGNAILVQADDTTLLIDCGLPTRRVEKALHQHGIDPAGLAAILLTHEHSDHIHSAGVVSRRYGVPVVANRRTLDEGAAILDKAPTRELRTGSGVTLGQVDVASFPIPHDAVEPVGYLLTYGNWRLCLILDAGKPSYEMRQPLRQADLVVIEANHDRERLVMGPYTRVLKARILSEMGHLSNLEAAQLLAETQDSHHRWAWLSHLSQTNNTPGLALRTVKHFLRHEGVKGLDLDISLRDHVSARWDSQSAVWQDSLFALDAPSPASQA